MVKGLKILKGKTTKSSLIILCGLPRSGKSTYARKNSKNAVIVCPDRIRKVIFGHQFHKEAEDFIINISKSFNGIYFIGFLFIRLL